ncbi:hypothetical protein PQR57_06210 [Paraburkholderia dipogonis]|uniref:Uncharacterized protein n=1 Tax=Paraburkholderia dipogonis TaxID=1211383 RepID=A0ABW9AMM1_9BURK
MAIHAVFVAASRTACSMRSRKISVLAKKNVASHRGMTSPGMQRPLRIAGDVAIALHLIDATADATHATGTA